jgi:putative spermidine/putrescine transport system substrate-binding protein
VSGLTRRDLLAQAAVGAGVLGLEARSSSAAVPADRTLRIATIGIDIGSIPSITSRAQQEIGVKILPEVSFGEEMNRWVRQQPAAFDIFEGYGFWLDPDWGSRHLQPIEISQVDRWREISPLLKLGKLRPGDPRCTYGQGDAAFRKLYLDPARSGRWKSAVGTPRALDGLLVEWVDERTGLPVGPEPRFCTGVPGYFNFDSFGYNARVIRKQPEDLSWAELLNRRWQGRVAIPDDPFISFQDTANAARAAGLVRIRDVGDPSRAEIDALFKLLFALRRGRHFYGVWPDYQTATEWMRSHHVVIESMWASSISPLAALGFPVRQAAPREGYRAWASIFSISTAVAHPAKLRACYDFLNWWHSGYAGSVMLRFGYFNAVAETARAFMGRNEYAYWVDGKPADRDYPGPYGDKVVRRGHLRDGGPFTRRACRIASWNSWPAEATLLQRRWYEFVSTF